MTFNMCVVPFVCSNNYLHRRQMTVSRTQCIKEAFKVIVFMGPLIFLAAQAPQRCMKLCGFLSLNPRQRTNEVRPYEETLDPHLELLSETLLFS